MQTLKIRMVDFWDNFSEKDNFFYHLLSRKYKVEVSDTPDFILYSVYGYEHLKFKCPRIFYTGENQIPDFNVCDYAMGFHHLHFEDRYKRIPFYYLYEADIARALKKSAFTNDDLQAKQHFCNFIYTNRKANPERDRIFQLLSDYKRVESGGKHLNNIGKQVDNKYEFQKYSKFTIAFENSSYPGYTTEKILHAFSAHTIPIYWGDPLVAEQFNPAAFINCLDFKNLEAVVDRVKEIDNNDGLYLQMMQAPLSLPDSGSEILNYLVGIFNQGKAAAYRRDRQFWGRRYEKILLRDKFPEKKNTVRKALRKVKKKIAGFYLQ